MKQILRRVVDNFSCCLWFHFFSSVQANFKILWTTACTIVNSYKETTMPKGRSQTQHTKLWTPLHKVMNTAKPTKLYINTGEFTCNFTALNLIAQAQSTIKISILVFRKCLNLFNYQDNDDRMVTIETCFESLFWRSLDISRRETGQRKRKDKSKKNSGPS